MYPQCEEWFLSKLDRRATPKLWNEVTLSSAKVHWDGPFAGFTPEITRAPRHTRAHAHAHSHRNPLVSLRRPPGREEGIARWDTLLSCGGSGWRGRRRSSVDLSPSLAAWARNVPLCVCGSWCNVQTPAGTPPGIAQFAPRCSGLDDLNRGRHPQRYRGNHRTCPSSIFKKCHAVKRKVITAGQLLHLQ